MLSKFIRYAQNLYRKEKSHTKNEVTEFSYARNLWTAGIMCGLGAIAHSLEITFWISKSNLAISLILFYLKLFFCTSYDIPLLYSSRPPHCPLPPGHQILPFNQHRTAMRPSTQRAFACLLFNWIRLNFFLVSGTNIKCSIANHWIALIFNGNWGIASAHNEHEHTAKKEDNDSLWQQ